MVDYGRNYKTLIVCFVIALFFLIPLRFVEEGNKAVYKSREQVLGDETVIVEEEIDEEQRLIDEVEIVLEEEVVEKKKIDIILPNSDIQYLIERVY
jgi:Skp family chaperone for outer membrane proteins